MYSNIMENEIQDNQGKEIPPPGIAEVESKIESSNKQLNTEKLGFKKKSVKNSNNLTKNKRERQKNNLDDFDKLSKVNTAKKDKSKLKRLTILLIKFYFYLKNGNS